MKKCLFFLLATILAMPSFAQSGDDEEDFTIRKTKRNAFFLGPKIGGTLTSLRESGDEKMADGSGFGFSGGLAFQARFGKASANSVGGTGYVSAGIELKYKQNKVKTLAFNDEGEANANMTLGYPEIPVYVHLYPFAKVSSLNSLYIEAGVSFAPLITRSPKSLTLLNPSPEAASKTYYLDDNDRKLKGGDIRPIVGLGYVIPRTGLDINVRYYIGTSELAGNMPYKMNSFEFSLAWMFNLGRF